VKFLIVTSFIEGEQFLINIDQIVKIYPYESGTRIQLTEGLNLVKESYSELKAAIFSL